MIPFKPRLLIPALLSMAASSVFAARPALNDTGAVLCRDDAGGYSLQCKGTGQDGAFGRDRLFNDASDGVAGFSFVKVCNSGEKAGGGSCPAQPVLGSGPDDWACTLDQVTGLLWEVKTADTGSRAMQWEYSQRLPQDPRYGAGDDAHGFVDGVNAGALCGRATWRLPDVRELQSIQHFGVATPGPMIDPAFFPNTAADVYWSRNASSFSDAEAWGVRFDYGFSAVDGDRLGYHKIRLVSGALPQLQRRFVPSVDGSELTDKLTRLVWRRCAGGQTWDGSTCQGTASYVKWKTALARARAAGEGWRLPNVKELASLVEPAANYPAMDALFPNPPFGVTWSSTPYLPQTEEVWAVEFGQGQVTDEWASEARGAYRLVRDAR